MHRSLLLRGHDPQSPLPVRDLHATKNVVDHHVMPVKGMELLPPQHHAQAGHIAAAHRLDDALFEVIPHPSPATAKRPETRPTPRSQHLHHLGSRRPLGWHHNGHSLDHRRHWRRRRGRRRRAATKGGHEDPAAHLTSSLAYNGEVRRTGWLSAIALALVWGVGPALPAMLRGDIIGHPFTDLFPSVWGLWAFVQDQPGLPNATMRLGHPDGMGYYFSSPIKGWLAWPLLPILGLTWTWNSLLIAARVGTVLAAFGAARAWGFGAKGALCAAAVYGTAPFFHGYAVEGIVEGTDGWTLAVWLWLLGAKRFRVAPLAFALVILSSWYLGMVGCLLLILAALHDRRAMWSAGGLVLAAPALAGFSGAFPGAAPLDESVRAMMGASLTIPTSGWQRGLQPFAMNAYVGWVVVGVAAWSRTRWALLAAIPAILSLGIGPIYDLPVAELVRFPYRWHAATLVLLAAAVATHADTLRWGRLLAWAIALEGWLLSPVEPILPSTRPDVPDIVTQIDGPVLDIPGPVAMPPGVVNRSRRRARYLMYEQTIHGQPTPWVPDFNSVGVTPSHRAQALEAIGRLDPLVSKTSPTTVPTEAIESLGVDLVQIHVSRLGQERAAAVQRALQQQGWQTDTEGHQRILMRRLSN